MSFSARIAANCTKLILQRLCQDFFESFKTIKNRFMYAIGALLLCVGAPIKSSPYRQ
jgi:hypothetical protein